MRHVEAQYEGIFFDLRLQISGKSFPSIKARTVQNSQRAGLLGSKSNTKSRPGDTLKKLGLHNSDMFAVGNNA